MSQLRNDVDRHPSVHRGAVVRLSDVELARTLRSIARTLEVSDPYRSEMLAEVAHRIEA